jgi:AmiR/NasT family two-component response regulator
VFGAAPGSSQDDLTGPWGMESHSRILIADDDALFRRDLREALLRMGHRVVGEASEGIEALKLARRLRPELAILDVRMPRLDGLQVAEAIARAEISPVLLITGHADAALMEQAHAARISGCLSKPFQEAELGRAIEAAVQQYRQAFRLRQEVRAMRTDPPMRELIRRAKSILMRQEGMNEPEAFARIQRDSLQSGRTLREVAAALVRPPRAFRRPRPDQTVRGDEGDNP